MSQTSMNISPGIVLIAVTVITALGVVGVILSPQNTVAIIGFCALSVPGLLALLQNSKAAEQREQVKTTLAVNEAKSDRKLAKIEATGEKTHTLVNSNMGAQLKLNAVATRRLADLTKDQDDINAANLAAKMLKEHEGRQAVVDATH